MKAKARAAVTLLAVAATLAAGACAAVPAFAATNPVLTDCNAHGALTKSYSIAQLRQALATMSASTKEYTSCPDVINRAIAAAVASGTTHGGTGASGSGSFLPTPVIVILVLLVLAGVTFGAVAVRRRRDDR
jgi:hypothetical protein